MKLSRDQIELAAAELLEAERRRRQIGLLSMKFEGLTLEDAYRIQDRLVQLKLESGLARIGWKIGLTSKAMQRALRIDLPDSGVLFNDMLFVNGATIPSTRFIQPRVEAEIAFIMRHSLPGASTTESDVVQATESITPAIEILDTRIFRLDPDTGTPRNVCDTVSDNAANAGIILADTRATVEEVDLRWLGTIVKRNGIVEETGLGAGVLDNPVKGIVWLARRLADFDHFVKAGDIVLAGSFIRPVEAQDGSFISADFGSFGKVECYFERDTAKS